MRMKGYRPFQRGLADTMRTEISSLRPVLAGAVRRSEQVALAIVTRGFSFEGTRTSLHEEHLRLWHWAALALMFLLTAGVGACKALFWLYQSEVYYTFSLRAVYQFTRDWL
jgi:energy-coupling factor transport system permease protein